MPLLRSCRRLIRLANFRQAQIEEERQRKIRELKESLERQKLEKAENKLRRIQLTESCAVFEGKALTIVVSDSSEKSSSAGVRDRIESIRTKIRQQKEVTNSPFAAAAPLT